MSSEKYNYNKKEYDLTDRIMNELKLNQDFAEKCFNILKNKYYSDDEKGRIEYLIDIKSPCYIPMNLESGKISLEKYKTLKLPNRQYLIAKELKSEYQDLMYNIEKEKKAKEELRQKENLRKQQEERKKEEERKRQEELKRQEERKKEEERKRQEELKRQEERTKEEERKRQEELKNHEELVLKNFNNQKTGLEGIISTIKLTLGFSIFVSVISYANAYNREMSELYTLGGVFSLFSAAELCAIDYFKKKLDSFKKKYDTFEKKEELWKIDESRKLLEEWERNYGSRK